MRITSVCMVVMSAAWLAACKEEPRGKRQLAPIGSGAPSSVSHYYNSGPLGGISSGSSSSSSSALRRISTGIHNPLYPPQFFPGPPARTHHRKGRPLPLPAPPYAVPMEPLAHYSQRDPLYGPTNSLSPNADAHPHLQEDDANRLESNIDRGGTIYVPHKPHIIEKPVYIKEPEPIIEIIIKESNVTLPPLPTPPPPPPKKKEEVQVFYVKYQKNPHGTGKDAIIYDKPVPAISPTVPDEEEEEPQPEEPIYPEENQGYNYNEVATNPPPPSTTLRTIIKPDSEVYHSPTGGIKVTFGKEGFDYDKRSSKLEDYQALQQQPQQQQPQPQQSSRQGNEPQPRQLSSFSNAYFKQPIPPPSFFQNLRNVFRDTPVRTPQSYKPFNFPSQNFNSRPQSRPPPPQSQSKYPFQNPPYIKPSNNGFNKPPFPAFAHTISHPAPHFQSSNNHPQQYNPNPNYHTIPQDVLNANPVPQQQLTKKPSGEFNPHPPQFTEQTKPRQPVPYKPFDNFKNDRPQPQATFTYPPQPQPQFPPTPPTTSKYNLPHSHNPIQFRPETHFPVHQQLPLQQQSSVFNGQGKNNLFNGQHHSQQSPQQFIQQQQSINQQQLSENEHLNNLKTAQSILPAGGQLIQSVPKFEQHLIVREPAQQSSNTQYKHEEVDNKQRPHQNEEQQQYSQQQYTPQHQEQQYSEQQQQQSQQQNQQQQPQQQSSLFNHAEYNKIQQQLLGSQENVQTNQYQPRYQTQQRNNNDQQTYSNHQQTTPRTVSIGPTKRIFQSSSTIKITTTTTEAPKPSTTTKDPKVLEAQLPDEVPEDLRQQLLSSGILNNADISILDYDKVGDIPLSALPPDQLANFYGAGGAQQLAAAGSEPIPKIVAQPLVRERVQEEEQMAEEASEVQEVRMKPEVEMKVVKYNPETHEGQKIQEAYVADDAKQVDPVLLNDSTYNRYLPLKVNGTQFPIPDVPELKGKKISSVVVLAPVAYDFSSERKARDTKHADLDLIQEESLKELLVNPTQENYKKFLEAQNKTDTTKQSVILLVTNGSDEKSDKEIYMYDVATRTVNKLNGELSAAFVDAAEANSANEDAKEVEPEASNIVETRVYLTDDSENHGIETSDLEESASSDLNPEASDVISTIVDTSGFPVKGSFSDINSIDNDVLITSGYTKTGQS